MADLPRLLAEERYRKRLLKRVRNGVVSDYWWQEHGPMRESGQTQVRAPLPNKIRGFLRHPLLHSIVSQSGGVNIPELIERRGVLLVRLDARLEESTALLGSMIVLRLLEAILGRRTVDSVATGAVNLVCFQLDPDDARDLSRHFGVPEPASIAAYSPTPIATLSSRGHCDAGIVEEARKITGLVQRARAAFVDQVHLCRVTPNMGSINQHVAKLERFLKAWAYNTVHDLTPPPLEPKIQEIFSGYCLQRDWPRIEVAMERIAQALRDEQALRP